MDELLEYTYVLIDSCELFPYASIKKKTVFYNPQDTF